MRNDSARLMMVAEDFGPHPSWLYRLESSNHAGCLKEYSFRRLTRGEVNLQLRFSLLVIFKTSWPRLYKARLIWRNFSISQLLKVLHWIAHLLYTREKYESECIGNSNWTKWSTIQGVIARVISKSVEREARGRIEITSTITPWIVRHEVQLLINRIYNKFRN